MFALLLAALIADPVPRHDIAFRAPPAQVQPVRQDPVLQSVAVTLECTARASGRVENCAVLGETHPGLGFGDAAVALMQGSQVDPGAQDVRFARTIQFMP